jgi:hypothetical protein
MVQFQILKSAELIGYFVPLPVSWPILSSAVSLGATEGNLAVLASVLSGTEKAVLSAHSTQIGDLISDPDVCQTLKRGNQGRILDICHVILQAEPTEEVGKVFKTILTVYALAMEEGNREKARGGTSDI